MPDDADHEDWRLRERIPVPQHPKDRCELADSNLQLAETAVLALPSPRPKAAGKSWNHKSPLAHFDLVDGRLHLSKEEKDRLTKNGFVVPARASEAGYAWAYHEIYQSQLPVFITVDSIFHAVYAAHDSLLTNIETDRLLPLLDNMLLNMHCTLADAAKNYPAETAHDLDVYLTVARSLLEHRVIAGQSGDPSVDREAAELVKQANDAAAMTEVSLFGRHRMIDFTQFTPRGHYSGNEKLEPYFRAVMWLARLEFNLVSRSSRSSAPGDAPDPSETPREDVDALALANLVERSGALANLGQFERAFELFAGRREDISVAHMLELGKKANITDLRAPEVATKLRAAIGDGYQRTARVHYMPQGSTNLPAILTLLGPRIVPDTVATRPLVHSETPERYRLGAADVDYFLGLDHARTYLADDLKKFPTLDKQLGEARRRLQSAPRTDDLYTAWLDAIRALSETPRGAAPSFMSTDAGDDLRMNSMTAAFAQLRHNYVLIAAQSYDEGGCEIPDGFVEPAPASYKALIHYADLGAQVMKELDPKDMTHAQSYFSSLGRVLRVLSKIVDIELADQPLPVDAKRFLSMVAEMTPGSTGGPPTYTGWYFDLFQRRDEDGLKGSELIADFYTSSNAGISYLGVSGTYLGVFVVDTSGGPRVMVGPVARAYQTWGDLSRRLDDNAALALPETERHDPWAASYTVPAPPEPSLKLNYEQSYENSGQPANKEVVHLEAADDLGPVTVELLDHNRNVLSSKTQKVGKGEASFEFPHPKKGISGIHLQVGVYQQWLEVLDVCSCASISLGSYRKPASDR